MKRQRLVIWIALTLSLATSVAFNALGTMLVTNEVPALVTAFVWPALALLAVEIMTKVKFPKGLIWTVARFGGVGLVGLITMAISFWHTHEILLSWRQPELIAWTAPLAIDGMMTLSGAALLALSVPVKRSPSRARRR
jgi:Protein of unknown function (DUF2637)